MRAPWSLLLFAWACADPAAPPDASLPAADAGRAEADAEVDAGADAGADGGLADTTSGPALGVLQFRVRHNLEEPGCAAQGSCRLSFEDERDPAVWAETIAPYTTQASLHFDRALPWTSFLDAPPAGADPVAFYDARLDPALRRYLDGHRAAFLARNQRYLAVSILGGVRDRVAPLRQDVGVEIPLGERCGALDPAAELQLPGGRRAPLLDTYQRFVSYLAAKLEPTDLALMVEVDLFRRSCPARWPGLVATYQELYDRLRAERGPAVRLFATLTVPGLLGFDNERCSGALRFVPCAEPAPAPPVLDPARCFPLEPEPLRDLTQDGRLDVLALSYYPSGFGFATPARGAEDLAAYPADSDGVGPCWMHARLPEALDPLAEVDRLGWSGEVAIAEWSARGAPAPFYFASATSTVVMSLGATTGDQAWWMERVMTRARARGFRFVNASFLEDYPAVGMWAVRDGALDASLTNLINGWAWSGLLDREGRPKAGVTERWTGAGR